MKTREGTKYKTGGQPWQKHARPVPKIPKGKRVLKAIGVGGHNPILTIADEMGLVLVETYASKYTPAGAFSMETADLKVPGSTNQGSKFNG